MGDLDISSKLRTLLTEEYANEAKPSDGEAYQKIREYHFQEQFNLEMQWWTRLSKHKTRTVIDQKKRTAVIMKCVEHMSYRKKENLWQNININGLTNIHGSVIQHSRMTFDLQALAHRFDE